MLIYQYLFVQFSSSFNSVHTNFRTFLLASYFSILMVKDVWTACGASSSSSTASGAAAGAAATPAPAIMTGASLMLSLFLRSWFKSGGVWSLTLVYSVGISQSRIFVKKSVVFTNTRPRFASIVFDRFLEPWGLAAYQAMSLYLCSSRRSKPGEVKGP